MKPQPLTARCPIPMSRRGAWTTLVAVAAVFVGIALATSDGDVLACDIEPAPSVSVEDLPTVLDPDGAWTDIYEDRPDLQVPTITGAYRMEVVDTTPESEDFFSSALWRQTTRWGAAEVLPVHVPEPVRKDEATNCDGNESPLGTNAYSLTTNAGFPVEINADGDDPRVAAALDDLFGPSETVTEEMAASVTTTPQPRTTVAPADRDTINGLRVFFRRFSFVAVAAVLALARLGFGRLFRRR